MDFPKSVPGVGLVGDRFVDEDPAIGRQGSLIPSVWGNAVTLELLNVIQAAGLNPSEAQTDQLLEAIRALVPERSAFARVNGTLSLPATAFGIYALADGGVASTVTLPSTADLVDDTELLLFANHSNTAVVQVKVAVGQTIQGPVALLLGSATAFMLPAGGDWVRLRSEKAQGRWVVVAWWTAARIAALENTHGQLVITGNGTLTGADNKLTLAGVVAGVKLNKGDVIRIDGAGEANAKLRTVESIPDANTVILNYEHCGARGNGPLKLVDFTGQITVTRIAKWYSAPGWLGQKRVNLASLRALNTTFTNTSGRAFEVEVSTTQIVTDVDFQFLVDGAVVNTQARGQPLSTGVSAMATVPDGSDYRINTNKPFVIATWNEGR